MIMRRYRMGSEVIPIQEVGNLHAIKIYCDVHDISRFVKQKLSDEDRERFADCTFVPIQVNWNNTDLTLEATIVPAQ